VSKPAGIVVVFSLLACRAVSAAPPGAARMAQTATPRESKDDTKHEPRMGVAPFGPASLSPDLRLHLEEAAATGLLATGAAVTPRTEIVRAASATATGQCSEPVCLKRLAEATATPIWLRGSCSIDGTTYRIHLELFDAAADTVVGARDDACEICTEAEVAETVNVAASTLRATWKHGPRPASAGAVAAVPGSKAPRPSPISETGASAAASTSGGSHPSTWRRVLPYVAFGGAVAATGLGVFFVYQDGRPVDPYDGTAIDKNRLDTKGLAIASFGVGAALLVTGIVLLALPPSNAPSRMEGHASSPPARQAAGISAVSLDVAGTTLRLSGSF
jgi:hypothetical protein